jgi:1,4-dihydroxy-2-naphthoate octaprenyltransferase
VSGTLQRQAKFWLLAIRPKTLFAALAPVMLGTALSYSHNEGHLLNAFAALMGAIGIQIGTNLANDYWDSKKGADTQDRLGPVRVTSSGLLSPRSVFIAMILAFVAAGFAGLYLIYVAGWPVFWIGVLSIFCGIIYTAGPFPLAYLGLGDVFTFVFFGPVATMGTYYVQAHAISFPALILGCIPGSYSVVLIALNNLRDRESDIVVNKKTLAVRFGLAFARAEIALGLYAPFIFTLLLFRDGHLSSTALSASMAVCILGGLVILVPVYRIRDMRLINGLFPRTGGLSLLMALILSLFLLF